MKGSIGIKILIAILVVLIIVTGALLAIKIINDRGLQGQIQTGQQDVENKEPEVVEIKEPTTFQGTDR